MTSPRIRIDFSIERQEVADLTRDLPWTIDGGIIAFAYLHSPVDFIIEGRRILLSGPTTETVIEAPAAGQPFRLGCSRLTGIPSNFL